MIWRFDKRTRIRQERGEGRQHSHFLSSRMSCEVLPKAQRDSKGHWKLKWQDSLRYIFKSLLRKREMWERLVSKHRVPVICGMKLWCQFHTFTAPQQDSWKQSMQCYIHFKNIKQKFFVSFHYKSIRNVWKYRYVKLDLNIKWFPHVFKHLVTLLVCTLFCFCIS